MLDGYVDIVVRDSMETAPSTLLGTLLGALHLKLVGEGGSSTGISFPNAGPALGDRLRLHDEPEALPRLVEGSWLVRYGDYFRIGAVREVPGDHGWRTVRRRQPKLSAAKARRMVARGSLDAAEAERLLSGTEPLGLPFVQLSSGSTGQRFKLFLEQLPCEPPRSRPSFNAYGLGGAVPWF